MEESKPNFTKKYTAEFNTSQDTLRQIAQMEWNIDEMFRGVYNGGLNSQDIPGIKNLYHYIVHIYADRLWALSWAVLQKDKDKNSQTFTKFEGELNIMYCDWIKNHKNEVPSALIEKLRDYKKWLYEIKQKQIKLGIPTKTETTAGERLDKVS